MKTVSSDGFQRSFEFALPPLLEPVVIITERETEVPPLLTRSGGNLIWGGGWHGLGQDVQVAIFRGEAVVRERGNYDGGLFPFPHRSLYPTRLPEKL